MRETAGDSPERADMLCWLERAVASEGKRDTRSDDGAGDGTEEEDEEEVDTF